MAPSPKMKANKAPISILAVTDEPPATLVNFNSTAPVIAGIDNKKKTV